MHMQIVSIYFDTMVFTFIIVSNGGEKYYSKKSYTFENECTKASLHVGYSQFGDDIDYIAILKNDVIVRMFSKDC